MQGKDIKKKEKVTNEADKFIRDKLQQKWSPDQISGYAKASTFFNR